MPIYPLTNKRTGKTYEMPWDQPDPPSEMDAIEFMDKQDNPSIASKALDVGKKAWSALNQPLTDLPSRAGKAVGEPLLNYGMNNKGLGASLARGAGAFSESLGDVTSSLTSPLSLGLAATTGGSSLAARTGLPATASALSIPGRAAAAGMIGHGGYNALRPGSTIPERLGGVVEAGLGGLGVRGPKAIPDIASEPFGPQPRDIAPQPFGPEKPPMGLGRSKGPDFTNPGFQNDMPVKEGQFTEAPPPAAPPQQLPPYRQKLLGGDVAPTETPGRLGLPPKSRTFYGGAGGTLGTDINEVPTRTFTGDPGLSRRIMKPGRVTPIMENRPPSLYETPPNPMKDILEQNSPYSRIMKGASSEAGSVVDPATPKTAAAPIPEAIPDVGPEITPPEPPVTPAPGPKKFTKPAGKAAKFGKAVGKFSKKMAKDQRGQVGDLGPSDIAADTLDVAPEATMPERQPSSFTQTVKDFAKRMATDETGAVTVGSDPEVARLRTANKLKAKDWATQRDAANHHANFAAEDFADLKDPALLDKFIAGDRTGRLKDVQDHLDQLFQEQVAAGAVNPKRTSLKSFLQDAANPEIGEHQEPIETIPEMLADATRKSKMSVANAKFDDYLKGTAQIDDKMSIKDPRSLYFNGPMSKQLDRYLANVTQESPEGLRATADVVSKTKNIYLAGGIPKTPLNIHGYNIARSRYMASGARGIGDFTNGVFNPASDVAYLKSERPLIQKAVDYGYGMTTENEAPDALKKLLAEKGGVVGKAANATMDWGKRMFEDPLFQVSLPANKARVLRENYDRLLPKVGEEQALRQASTIANDFMGGINKSLRNKTYKDLLQIGILAPDWAESRINLAVKGAKSLVGKEDPIYAKALGRGGVMRAAGAAAQAGLGQERGEKPSDLTSVGLGTTDSGKHREASIYGTAVEALRVPEEAARGMMTGDFRPVTRIVRNRLSQPVQSGLNLFYTGEDAFGNPLSGKDKYNRQIPAGQTALNYAQELTASLQPQQLQSLVGYLRGKQGGEEALAQALELPVKYASPPPPPPPRRMRRRR